MKSPQQYWDNLMNKTYISNISLVTLYPFQDVKTGMSINVIIQGSKSYNNTSSK